MPDKDNFLRRNWFFVLVFRWSWLVALVLIIGSGIAKAEDQAILLQSTTSTQNSGLYDAILPQFTEMTGIKVKVVAAGTGQAIKNAMNGDSDVLLVHAKSSEEKFINDGYGVERIDVMYNDFVLVGPSADPVGLKNVGSIAEALKKISLGGAIFVSRGDKSGTHIKEMELWRDAGINPMPESGRWYLETGSSMGSTLNVAVGKNAYCLTDRSTWISFNNKGSVKIVVEGHPELFNQYGVILVNQEIHPHVRAVEGQVFIDWIVGEKGQQAIASYTVGGEQLFFPNAQ